MLERVLSGVVQRLAVLVAVNDLGWCFSKEEIGPI